MTRRHPAVRGAAAREAARRHPAALRAARAAGSRASRAAGSRARGQRAAGRPGAAGLPAVWLRFNCRCPLCRDPVSGQRLLRITDIPADISVAGITASSGTVRVLFHPDGHRAVFDQDWLARYGEPGRNSARRTRGPRTPSGCGPQPAWAATRPADPGRVTWPTPVTGGPASRRSCVTGCCCSARCRRTPARCWRWPRAWAMSGRPTTAGSSTSGSRPRQPTWPSPACPSRRTRTTRTGTRFPPCSCCTAWTTRPTGAIRGSWTGSTQPPRSARRIPAAFATLAVTPVTFGTATRPRSFRRPGR